MTKKEVIKNYENLKLEKISSNFLKKYIKIFNKHYKSSIDLILTKKDSKEQINYNDIIFLLKKKSILRRYYTQKETEKRLINYTKYYSKNGDFSLYYYKNKKHHKIMFKNKKRKFRMCKNLKFNEENLGEENIQFSDDFLCKLNKKTNYINELKMEDSIEKNKKIYDLCFENYFQINLLDLRFFTEIHDIYNPEFSSEESRNIKNTSISNNRQFNYKSINLTDLSIKTYITDFESIEISDIVFKENEYENSFLLEDFFGREKNLWSKKKNLTNLKETDLNSNSGEKFNRTFLKTKINILENSSFINKRKTFNNEKYRESLYLRKNNNSYKSQINIKSSLTTIKNLKKKKAKKKLKKKKKLI